MTNDKLNEQLRDFLLERFPLVRKRGLNFDDNLLEGGVLDSLGILDLVAFIEREFQVVLSDEELLPENFESISHITAFIRNKVPAAGGQQA
ncbi:MAG TPA: acyl carrier protein [Candidatus Acidoferrum sp.]|nr:acyl carrier protein [Candidatus Acidoferrum sp.]